MFALVLISLTLAGIINVSGFTIHTPIFTPCKRLLRNTQLHLNKNNEDLMDLRIDLTKLSPAEQERLAFIQKLTNEADEFAKAAGFDVDVEVEEKDVASTKWSGQSDVETSRISKNNWGDLAARPGLLSGDILSLLLFAWIGRSNHNEGLDLLNVLGTASPFIISWVVISPLLGAFSRKATSSIKSIPIQLLFPWAVSIPGGLVIRGLLKGVTPPVPFIIVSMVATFVLLTLWRVLFVSAVGGTSDEEYRKAGSFEIFKMIGTLIRRW
jgi:Protein of unknown function (DUF3054)